MTHISLILGRVLHKRYLLCAVSMASLLHAPSVLAQGKNNLPVAQSHASPGAINLQEHYPGGTIQSVEVADRALADVDKERETIETQFKTEQRACYAKFFANACVDEAKERRRVSLAKIRPVEIEANAFKRRVRVIERDKALAEKHTEDERKRLQRAQQEQANPAESPKDPDVAAQKPVPAGIDQKNAGTTPEDRVKQHEERLKHLQAEDQANAQKRAENVAAYEKKVQKAQERQRRVEEKKKEKELKKAKQASQPKQ